MGTYLSVFGGLFSSPVWSHWSLDIMALFFCFYGCVAFTWTDEYNGWLLALLIYGNLCYSCFVFSEMSFIFATIYAYSLRALSFTREHSLACFTQLVLYIWYLPYFNVLQSARVFATCVVRR